FGVASKRNVLICDRERPPFSRLRSTSIATLPFATIIFSRVPVWVTGPSCLRRARDLSELLLTRKSETRVIRMVFNIKSRISKFFGHYDLRTRTVLEERRQV